MTTIKNRYTPLFLSFLFSVLLLIPAHAGVSNAEMARSQTAGPKGAFSGKIAATVNGEQITRQELAKECLRHYGEGVLSSLINIRLVEEACRRNGIKITSKDIDAEIARMAKRFGITVDQHYKLLENQRGFDPYEYRKMVWSRLAQMRLKSNDMKVTNEEIQKAYEMQYGPSVKVRLIVVKDLNLAKEIRAKAVADPNVFPDLAKKHSLDAASASSKGWLASVTP